MFLPPAFRSLSLALLALPHLSAAQAWEPVGAGCNSSVYSLEPYHDTLYAAGTFTQAGGGNAHYVARWDGSSWDDFSALSVYMASDGLHAHDSALYMSNAGNVSLWNGNIRIDLPGVTNSPANTIAHAGTTLYRGGPFTVVHDTVPMLRASRWTGTDWDTLASGCDAQVNTMTEFNGQLFAGGNFQVAGGVFAAHTALWDGIAWHAMGAGVNDDVFTQCFYRDTLYIGGRFTQANGSPASHVAKWNGTEWVRVGGPLDDFVTAMAVYRDQLYIGGAFTTPATHIARLSGQTWLPVGTGVDDDVKTMEVYHDTLFVGGHFTQAGGMPAAHIAKWGLPAAPIALFTPGGSPICAPGCTTFIDASIGQPTSWDWSFPGGTPATSTEQSPTVCYDLPGSYDASLTVTNIGGSTTSTQAGVLTVEVCTGVNEAGRSSGIMLSPNPARDRVRIERGPGTGPAMLTLIDAVGRVQLRRAFPNDVLDLDVSGADAGSYVVVIESSAARTFSRLEIR